jgi:hypothetical protein
VRGPVGGEKGCGENKMIDNGIEQRGGGGLVWEGGSGAWAAVALGCWAVCYGPDPVNSLVSNLFKKIKLI